jgi:2-alkyl-3-oxoalkanoate reductase
LVTGGGGFIGGALVRRLLADGVRVRSVSRGHYRDLEALGVEQIRGDLGDPAVAARAVTDCGTVFHVAAKAGIWGSKASFWRSNVEATDHLIAASRAAGVTRFVFTSSPSVAQTDSGCAGGDESQPIPATHRTHYQASKALSEARVLAANAPELGTVALRPRLVWGPGDRHLVPRLVARAEQGRLRLVDGGGAAVDSTVIDNAVDAHVLAADALDGESSACAGKAYFISNGEPRPMGTLINQLLEASGAPTVDKGISGRFAFVLGAGLEAIWTVFRLGGEPPMTRFLARQLSTPNWYDLSAAARDLGYRPAVSLDEGLERLACERRGNLGKDPS